MFSGIQEILVLVAIILGIVFLPRILNRGQEKKSAASKPAVVLSGKMRLAIAASVLWPAAMAVAAVARPCRSVSAGIGFSLQVVARNIGITSYSIHYTKLYELAPILSSSPFQPRVARPSSRSSVTVITSYSLHYTKLYEG